VLLRDGRYKYIRTLVAGEPEELYDLEADPEELVNLALGAEHAERLIELRARAIEQLRATNAGFVEHMPPSRQMSEH
jgi:arylsulfatase A-like enzyme